MALGRDWAAPRVIQLAPKLLYQKMMDRLQFGEIENRSGCPNELQPSMGPSAGYYW